MLNFVKELVIGKILGDGHLNKDGNLIIEHSIKQEEYIHHCYILLKKYTNKGIKKKVKLIKGKKYISLIFNTKSLFKDYIKIFYQYNEIKNQRIKILPLNIKELLTPISLGY